MGRARSFLTRRDIFDVAYPVLSVSYNSIFFKLFSDFCEVPFLGHAIIWVHPVCYTFRSWLVALAGTRASLSSPASYTYPTGVAFCILRGPLIRFFENIYFSSSFVPETIVRLFYDRPNGDIPNSHSHSMNLFSLSHSYTRIWRSKLSLKNKLSFLILSLSQYKNEKDREYKEDISCSCRNKLVGHEIMYGLHSSGQINHLLEKGISYSTNRLYKAHFLRGYPSHDRKTSEGINSFFLQGVINSFRLSLLNIIKSLLTSSSKLLFLLPSAKEEVESFRWSDLRRSPLLVTLPREDAWMGCSVGRNLSPCDVFRMRSKNGTDPFFGKPDTCVVNAGCEAFRGNFDFKSSARKSQGGSVGY